MDVTATDPATAGQHQPTPVSARLPGPDVVRAVAMLGVITMNYVGYMLLRGGRLGGDWAGDLFDPWTGPLSTRFAATFVLTAGVGVTLLTRSSIGDRARTADMRWRLVRRGLLLYGVGLVFDFVWPGTILVYYGAMFVVAALLFTLRTRWVLAIGVASALAGWSVNWWMYERELDGHDTRWLTDPGSRSPRALLTDVAFNGTHPLLPWLAFFCAGIVVGRVLDHDWRWRGAFIGGLLWAASAIAASAGTSERARTVLSDDPFDRGLVYTASALGTALIAFAVISSLADSSAGSPVVDALRRAGQMSLTIYVSHALVFNLLVDWLDVIRPGGIATSLAFAWTYWIVVTAAAVAYHRRFGRGPVEQLYRRLTA